MNKLTGTLAGLALLGGACAAPTGETPDSDLASSLEASSAGKADGHERGEWERHRGRLFVYGDAADDLYSVLEAAGFHSASRAGFDYRVGNYMTCVTDGSASACSVRAYPREDDDYLVTIHGPRFRSAASELFGALAWASGTSPVDTTFVESRRFACGKDRRNVWCALREEPAAALALSFDGLGELGPDFVYEGWLITSDGPITSGRFDAPAEGETLTFDVEPELAADSSAFVLTIEPRVGDDPAPSSVHIVAGDIEDGIAELDTAHPAAIGTDFADAAGDFILATPSSPAMDDNDLGIWFLDPSAGPGPSLTLPELPDGWVYEGWVVDEAGPVSTGTFVTPDGPDSDGAGPTAGPNAAPPFPGQDFIHPPMSLPGRTAVISVEPSPDDSPAPFAIKPLTGAIMEDGGMLSSTEGETLPTGVAELAVD
jgi:hypothetical protein